VAALDAAVAVRRDIRDDVCGRTRYTLRDEIGSLSYEEADPALLPGANERTRGSRVRDGRAC